MSPAHSVSIHFSLFVNPEAISGGAAGPWPGLQDHRVALCENGLDVCEEEGRQSCYSNYTACAYSMLLTAGPKIDMLVLLTVQPSR